MGNWSKHEFKRSKLPKRCFLFAGTTPEERKDKILNKFNEILFHKHDVYERYIVTDGKQEYIILFQVYGAPTITDITHILNDGEVEEIIFIGAAYGINEQLRVGDLVISNKVQALDGLLKINFDVDYSYPDENLKEKIKNILEKNNEDYLEGKSVSVPSSFCHPDNSKYDKDVVALEMEFSSVCYFTKKFNIKCAGVFVISDTSNHSLLDDQNKRFENIINSFEIIKDDLD
jgi:purine-nucleoside phosphorylase